MRADETELRRHLAATAAGASAPRFTAGDVAVRVWRLRRRRARIAAGASAAVVAAAAVALPLWLGGISPAGTPAGGQPPSAVTGASKSAPSSVAGASNPAPSSVAGAPTSFPPLPWTVTVNGRTATMRGAAEPQFGVARGEHVTIVITVTVPAHDQLTKLILGITGNTAGIGPRGPIGMKPVLATVAGLGPGKHAFTVRWTVPSGTEPAHGYRLTMAVYWPRENKDEAGAGMVPMVTFVARSQATG